MKITSNGKPAAACNNYQIVHTKNSSIIIIIIVSRGARSKSRIDYHCRASRMAVWSIGK